MPRLNTEKQRQLQVTAQNIVAEFGIEKLDTLNDYARGQSLRQLAKRLRGLTGVSPQTSRHYLAQACRQLRHPTFGHLPIGQHFHLNIDADGYEPVYYKASETEAYQYAGGHSGKRKTFKPDTRVYPINQTTPLHATYTEIERAALTLIARHRAEHPALHGWKTAMLNKMDEFRQLDEVAWEQRHLLVNDRGETLEQLCQACGYWFPTKKWGPFGSEPLLFALIWDREPAGEYTNRNGKHPVNHQYDENGGRYDRALLALCTAVCDYREAGRPDGDQTHTIMGMGAPLMGISTSLAAAVVEYHERMINILMYETRIKKTEE